MLREYRHTDMDGAMELYMDTFADPPFNYSWMERDRIRRYFVDMENTPGFKGFVYERDGALAGLCLGTVQDYFACCVYDIKELVVAADCRGSGVGTELLTGAEERLAGLGVELMSLATSAELPAFGFYKKNGYEVSDSTVWMGKRI